MRRIPRSAWVAAAVLLAAALYASRAPNPLEDPRSTGRIGELYAERLSGTFVEGTGIVAKLLPDDRKGSRHQRFIVRLDSGQTLLVSHNIDLAPRVDGIRVGDELEFRGEYEWNELGGVVHWTHHDPKGRQPGGWLRHRGTTYR